MKTFSKIVMAAALLGLNAYGQEDTRGNEIRNSIPDMPLVATLRHRGGNGGDTIGGQFSTIASNGLKVLKSHCAQRPHELCDSIESFEKAFQKNGPEFVTVLSDDVVEADDGNPRDAVNFVHTDGKRYIVVSRERWKAIESMGYRQAEKKITLVLHEYFSLLGLETSDYYAASDKFLTMAQNEDYDLEKVAGSSSLPEPNSMRMVEPEKNELERAKKLEVQSKLIQLGYDIKSEASESRYDFKINVTCNGFLMKTCSGYLELVDQYKKYDKVPYDDLIIEKAMGKKKAINLLLTQAFSDFPAFRQ